MRGFGRCRGGRSNVPHGVGRERESELRERERVREWARGGWRAVRDFNAAHGEGRESSTVGTWWRPTILGHGAGETEPSQTVRSPQALSARLDVTLPLACTIVSLNEKVSLTLQDNLSLHYMLIMKIVAAT